MPSDLAELDRAVRLQFEQIWNEGRDVAPAARRNWGALAQWFHVYRYHDSAMRSYTNAMRVEPAEPRWPYLMGLLVAEHGDPARARELLLRAETLAPHMHHVKVQLGDLARSEGNLAEAEQRYQGVLALRPADAAARFGLGQIALQRGDAAAALHWLEPLSEEQAQADDLNYALAVALRLSGDIERARTLLERVPDQNLHQVGLRRDDPWQLELMRTDLGARGLSRRAVQAVRRGEHQRAAVLFGAAVQRDPDGPEERLNWGLALARLGHHQQAAEQFREAIARAEPGSELHARGRLEFARLHVAAGRPRRAQALLQQLLDEHPEESRARVELSRLLHSSGDLDGALRQYQALREAGAFGAEAAFWQAAARLSLGRLDSAAEQLAADLPVFPGAAPLRHLQWRLIATKEAVDSNALGAALRELTLALEEPPDLIEAETLAMLYAALGEYPTAVAWQQAATDTLLDVSRAASLRIARRRLTLYREGKRPSQAWESAEQPLELPVRSPYPALPSAP